jgi:hypothetical protein
MSARFHRRAVMILWRHYSPRKLGEMVAYLDRVYLFWRSVFLIILFFVRASYLRNL